ncbi:MAG: hypothetical protein C0407_11325 [Desulfobacca sp.]|nr:hypothetical protein [Desulfobacca sp.]
MSKEISRVTVYRCPDYTPTNLSMAVQAILSDLEPLPFFKGAQVLLKPNCLSAHHGPDRPVNTRVEVVIAVGQYLRTHHQVELIIADSGGMGSYGKSKRAYSLMRLDRAAELLGAQLVNLEEWGLIDLQSPRGKVLPNFKVTALLNQIDVIVNLPKLKTHILTGITGAIKNYLGLLPGSLKRAVHVVAPSGQAMALALVDILAGIKEKVPLTLNLMDGIIAMEGAGPSHGQPKETGWLLASTDPVALDYVAATIMGFVPSKIPTIKAAAEAGLGTSDLSCIELQGAAWQELPVPGFQHPFTRAREWIERIVPNALIGRAFDWVYEAKPKVRTKLCQKCNLCVQACPAQALEVTEQGLQLNPKLCIECYCCLEHCPHEGLWVPRGLIDRIRGPR